MGVNVKADPEGAKAINLPVFEVVDQTLVYKKSPVLHYQDLCRISPLHLTVWETFIHSYKKGLTWDSVLEMVSYNGSSKISSQQPEWTIVTTNVLRMPRRGLLYRSEPT